MLRAVGAISRGKATSGSGGVKSESFIEKIRMVKGELRKGGQGIEEGGRGEGVGGGKGEGQDIVTQRSEC